jgi:hypothetical protein
MSPEKQHEATRRMLGEVVPLVLTPRSDLDPANESSLTTSGKADRRTGEGHRLGSDFALTERNQVRPVALSCSYRSQLGSNGGVRALDRAYVHYPAAKIHPRALESKLCTFRSRQGHEGCDLL